MVVEDIYVGNMLRQRLWSRTMSEQRWVSFDTVQEVQGLDGWYPVREGDPRRIRAPLARDVGEPASADAWSTRIRHRYRRGAGKRYYDVAIDGNDLRWRAAMTEWQKIAAYLSGLQEELRIWLSRFQIRCVCSDADSQRDCPAGSHNKTPCITVGYYMDTLREYPVESLVDWREWFSHLGELIEVIGEASSPEPPGFHLWERAARTRSEFSQADLDEVISGLPAV